VDALTSDWVVVSDIGGHTTWGMLRLATWTVPRGAGLDVKFEIAGDVAHQMEKCNIPSYSKSSLSSKVVYLHLRYVKTVLPVV
jgi:hypothetical protein